MTTSQSSFTLNDFLNEMDVFRKSEVFITALPNLAAATQCACAMIQAMTPDERADLSIITPSRLSRIAKGSGTKPEDVAIMLGDFGKMINSFSFQMTQAELYGMKTKDIEHRLLEEMRIGR